MAETNVTSPVRRVLSWIGLLAVVVFAVMIGAGAYLLGRFSSDSPVDYQSDIDHFKYGSLGSEHEFGVPYWIWRALGGCHWLRQLTVPGSYRQRSRHDPCQNLF